LSEAVPRVLVVAGHDSSGGAGVDADREALEQVGVDGAVVVTAWTRQDDGGVRELGAVDPGAWLEEARGHLGPGLGALKLGLLPGTAAVLAARVLVSELPAGTPAVLDPVLASSSGTRFHDAAGVEALREELLPAGLWWTPNVPELAELTGADPRRLAGVPRERLDRARELLRGGAAGVVVKGGHGGENPVQDLVVPAEGEPVWVEHPRVADAVLRGTGCRFASALAAQLARGTAPHEAVGRAGIWITRLLLRALGER
jgi:hydroxymethylpyrimidine/phosphomethylpyrimidine kinase